jgi:hypothetical protein
MGALDQTVAALRAFALGGIGGQSPAITGVIFFGTLGGGFAHAFILSTRLLPARKAT